MRRAATPFGPPPYRVALVVRWTPWPHLAPRLALQWRWHVAKAPSLDAALAAARAALERVPAEGPHPDRGRRIEAVLCDGRGITRSLGRQPADIRDAARRGAGWIGPPPEPRLPPATVTVRAVGGLTSAQRAVVEHAGGPAVVLAVAGAGKTTTMVARVAHLVERGVEPASILVTSFSRAAVADVRARLERDPALTDVQTGTFHSLAHRIVRTADERGDRATRRQGPAPDRVVRALAVEVLERWHRSGRGEDVDLADFLAYRGRCLAALTLPDPDGWRLPPSVRRRVRPAPHDPSAPAHRPLADDVERLRRERGWLDFDAMIVEAWAALARDPALRDEFRTRWQHVLVDEFQDVNLAQVALLEVMLPDGGHVMAIGDDDQSIYAFRGSDPSLLARFGAHHGARTYVLDHAFRSRAEAVAAAARLVTRVGGRAAKTLRTVRGRGGCCTLDVARDVRSEAHQAAERLLAARHDGFALAHQAVLLRAFAQAPPIEEALIAAGLPYRLLGAARLDLTPHARALLALLRLVSGSVRAERRIARAWRRLLGGVGSSAVPAVRLLPRLVAATASGASPPAALRAALDRAAPDRLASLAATMERIAAAPTVGEALRMGAATIGRWPRSGPADFALAAFLRVAQAGGWGAADAPTAAWLLGYRRWRAQLARERDAVTVTSVHRSKGLEWDVVVVPGQALGTFPRSASDEERRLAYVAWTRARERLHLLRPTGPPPSPFLVEADVAGLVALQHDLAWLEARGGASLAATWARREAFERFGEAPPDPERC
jgi:DNA helicase II / ATP-dependent DNA helicase PcrA